MLPHIAQLIKSREFSVKSIGTSMLPLLRPDDTVSIARIRFEKIDVNDVVMVKKKTNIFVHRVIYKNTSYCITKGDSNDVSDGKILPRQVIGKVYQVKRDGQIFSPDDIYLLQSTNYFNEIVRVKKAFERESINLVFLKGLPLHLYFEKTHPRRLYADCDILIDKKEWTKALKILEKLEYKSSDASFSHIHRVLKNKITEVTYYKYIHNFRVIFDVHHEAGFLMNQLGRLDELYPQAFIDRLTRRFLQEKKLVKIHSHSFPILSPENLILYLALHFYHHNYKGIYRLEFLKTVLLKHMRRPLLFFQMSSAIREFHVEGFTYPVFMMLEKYDHIALPSQFMKDIYPGKSKYDYGQRMINTISPFDDESQFSAGIARFKNLFFLSPFSLHRKMRIIYNPQVMYSFLWVMIRFVNKSFLLTLRTNFHKIDS